MITPKIRDEALVGHEAETPVPSAVPEVSWDFIYTMRMTNTPWLLKYFQDGRFKIHYAPALTNSDVPRLNYLPVPWRVAPGLPEMLQGKKSYGSEHTHIFRILRYGHLHDWA